MTLLQRLAAWLAGRAGVSPAAVGRPGDGLLPAYRGGTGLDKPWAEQSQELGDALEAWRTNPLAHRIVGLVTAYVVGDGIELRSHYPPLARFITRFCHHPQNNLALRQFAWCDELTRAGELFIVLHTNPADGMSYVRTLPAAAIDRIEWQPGDYETELRYHERVGPDDPAYPEGRWWVSAEIETRDREGDREKDRDGKAGAGGDRDAGWAGDGVPMGNGGASIKRDEVRAGASMWDGKPDEVRATASMWDGKGDSPAGAGSPSLSPASISPIVLHFAVNRPVGCLRGESDLAAVLPWMRRYSRWLEDRVRLNAAVRAFLWVVRVPEKLVAQKRAEYARPPEAGSVMVVDKGGEEWEAVAPRLNANDAAADGRAIRWMVVAGGPGLGLVDMGEAETANLATAQAMGEQRWRFMRQRQAYFGYVLAQTALAAYNRAVRLGKVAGRVKELDALEVGLPDITTSDNATLGSGAASVAQALETLGRLGLQGESFRRLAARVVLGFAGETLPERDLEALLAESGGKQ